MAIVSPRLLSGLLLAVFCLAAGPGLAATPDADAQKSKAADAPEKNWIGKQLSHFKAYPHLDMAYRLMKENKLAEAEKEFQLYLQLQPDDVKARSDSMNLLYNMGRYAEARAESRRILAAAPDNAAALLTSGLSLMRDGDPSAAMAPMQRAVELTKNDPTAHRVAVLATADVLARLDRYKEALDLIGTLPANQDDAAVRQAKGALWAKKGDTALALEAFQSALDIARNDRERLDALRSLAVTSADAGNLVKAQDYLTRARAMAPDDPVLLHQQAVVANKTGNSEEAARLGQDLVHQAPTPENKIFLANVLASLKRYDEAAGELQPLLAQNPAPREAFRLNMQLGVLAMDANKPEEAAKYLRAAVALRPEPLALVRLSRAEEQAGHPQEAAETLKKAVAQGASADALVELATLLTKLDQNAAALASLDKALAGDLSPEQRARTLGMKATLLAENGNNAAARKALEAAVKTAGPDQSRLLENLGEVDLRLGDARAAVAAYEQAVAAGAGQDARQSLAEALVKDGRAEKALDIYKTLAEQAESPQKKAAYQLGMANLLSRLGQNAQAAALYLELAKSGGPQLLLKAGQSFAAAKMGNQAVTSFDTYLKSASSPKEKAEALLALGNVYAGRRDAAKAYATFSRASALAASLPRTEQADLALALGTAAVLSGQSAKAVAPLVQAVGLIDDGARKAKARIALAQVYGNLGQTQKLVQAWTRAAQTPGALPKDVATAEESLGYALAASGDLAGAEAAFRRALALSGSNWRLLAALGQVAFKSGRYQEALDDFSRAMALHPDINTSIALGRSYDKLGKPGLAIVNFDEAAPKIASLPAKERRDFYLAQGFLYAEEFRYDLAIKAFEAGLELGYDPVTATRLGRLERLSGHPQEAKKRLEAVDPNALPTNLQILRLSELASIAEADKDYETATALLQSSLEVKNDPDTAFRLGNVQRDSGHRKEALAAYRQAADMENSNKYLTSLGYALSDDKQYAEAAKVFETVLARDADYLALWEDLGYAYMHDCQNDKSVDRFKRAIDNAPLRPVDSDADREKVERDVYRMRKEVTKLETHFTTTAYMSYIAGDAGPTPGGGDSANTIRSGAGVEFAWIPPKIGFRDDRIFQIIGRVTSNFNKDTLEFDDKSWQGAVGVRYKPLKSQNLNIGFERLFKIGQSAEENWLLRGMYSWTNGYDVKPREKYWNYSFLYGEYDYYMENDRRSMFYVEGRQGISFNIRDRFLITPHLVADFRLWAPDANQSSYIEGGAGISFKYLFNKAEYEVYRSSLEVLLQYKYGNLFNKTDVTDRENLINALFITTILKF